MQPLVARLQLDDPSGVRQIHYAGSNFLTGDRTCKALMRYARALTAASRSDIVQIPVVTMGGSRAYAHVLLGPGSQILSIPVPDSPDEPFDAEVVAKLEEATRRLQPARPDWPEEMTDVPDLDLDWLS